VVLLGIEMPRCAKCGAREIEIPHLDRLHRRLASAIVDKRGRLAPSEIRFLRSSMGWTGVEMARHIGVTPEAVSRWENAKDTIGTIADRLVRMVAAAQLGAHAPVEVLTELTDDAAPLELRVRFGHDGWRIAGASDPAEAWANAAPEDRAAVLEALAPQRFDERRRPIAEAAGAVLRRLE
jgi:putative zinc finger/helix-turn-helix YgiT family protein